MGVMEILREYVHELDPKVKVVLIEVIMAEQAMIDLDKPRIKERIKDAIDAAVRDEERAR